MALGAVRPERHVAADCIVIAEKQRVAFYSIDANGVSGSDDDFVNAQNRQHPIDQSLR